MAWFRGIPALIFIAILVILGVVLDGGIRKLTWVAAAVVAVIAAFTEVTYGD